MKYKTMATALQVGFKKEFLKGKISLKYKKKY